MGLPPRPTGAARATAIPTPSPAIASPPPPPAATRAAAATRPAAATGATAPRAATRVVISIIVAAATGERAAEAGPGKAKHRQRGNTGLDRVPPARRLLVFAFFRCFEVQVHVTLILNGQSWA